MSKLNDTMNTEVESDKAKKIKNHRYEMLQMVENVVRFAPTGFKIRILGDSFMIMRPELRTKNAVPFLSERWIHKIVETRSIPIAD